MSKLDPRLEPLVRELRNVLREKGVQLQQVDAEKGWSKGYMSQAVNGHKDLKLAHLYDALEVAKVKPETFFSRLAGLSPSEDIAALVRRVAALERGLEEQAGDG